MVFVFPICMHCRSNFQHIPLQWSFRLICKTIYFCQDLFNILVLRQGQFQAKNNG